MGTVANHMAAMMAMNPRSGNGKTVVIIEDERAIGNLICTYLEREGYKVETAETGEQGIELIRQINPHVVLLDLTLPTMTGWEVLRALRSRSNMPVITVTGSAGDADRLRGFEEGADDYVVKPFSPRELVARIAAVLRRYNPVFEESLVIGPLSIDPQRREVRVDGVLVTLREREFDLLAYLAYRKDAVCSRAELLDQIWGFDFNGNERTIDTHVRRVRVALGVAGSMLHTVWGIGYRLVASPS